MGEGGGPVVRGGEADADRVSPLRRGVPASDGFPPGEQFLDAKLKCIVQCLAMSFFHYSRYVSHKEIENPEFCMCDWFNNLNLCTSLSTTCKLPPCFR
ncbi:hypothetical protein CFC21_107492 [Triticum aestivum]|uniref:Uncharacterized protein n=2 Tax=Triticum aestivum TaxID=4565 RepID=A0A3B6TKX3_WHEAT|nr:hypothetical protein CFC21_107492 [Triticum aestivum]